MARFFGERKARGWLYSRCVPEYFVDSGYRVCGADGIFHRYVEVGEEARVDLAVRREPQATAPSAERFGDGRYDAERARSTLEAELVGYVRYAAPAAFA